MKKKKLLVTGLAVALAAAMMFGGTLAYLTDSTEAVENDFATNQNSVDLKETTDGYDIVPGTEQEKDPTVTATYTLDSYVYVVVTDATDGLVTYSIENGWILMSEETDEETGVTTYIYYQLLTADEDENTTVLSVLAGNTVSYSSSLTNKDLENAEDISLTFQAYIIQAEPFADAENAWLVLNGEGIWINSTTGVVYTDTCNGSTCGLGEALSEASAGDIITLLAESYACTCSDIELKTAVTIDLDEKSMSATHISVYTDADLVLANGTFTISTGVAENANSDGTEAETANLYLQNATLTASTTSGFAIQWFNGVVTVDGASTVTNTTGTAIFLGSSSTVQNKVTLNVYGTVSSTGDGSYNAITGNGSYDNTTTIINIYDGASVIHTGGIVIYHPQDNGTLNVYGGTISGYCGIVVVGGTVNISGGTISGISNDADYRSGTSTSAYYNGCGMVVLAGTSGYSDVTVNITGGTITSTYCYGIYVDQLNNAAHTATITIDGGTISGVASTNSNVNQTASDADGAYGISNAAASGSLVTLKDNR